MDIAQLCRSPILPAWYRRIQSVTVPQLLASHFRHLDEHLPDSHMDGYRAMHNWPYSGRSGSHLQLLAGTAPNIYTFGFEDSILT